MPDRAAAIRPLTLLGTLLLALTLAALALHVPGADTLGPDSRKALFVALLALAAIAYFAAIARIERGVPRHAVWLVIAFAIALRVGPLLTDPFLSSDVNRYVWDGRVQAAGINPYLYVPADPALAALRDETIFPRINRAASAPTIYPPAAQLIFAAIGLSFSSVIAMKTAMVGFEAMAMAAAAAVLIRLGRNPAGIVIWAWNPLTIWAFAGNGHVDAAAAGLLAVTLLLTARGRGTAAGLAFGAAVLVKLLPIAAAAALWPRGRWRTAIAAALTMLALYACYAGAGARILGFLTGYGADEGLTDGSGFWLLAGLAHLMPLPAAAGALYAAAAAIALAALSLWIAFIRRPTTEAGIWRDAGLLMAALTVAISPHYPWYFAWLALPAMVTGSRALIWLATAPLLLYLDPLHERFVWPCLVYLPAFALAIADRRHNPGAAA